MKIASLNCYGLKSNNKYVNKLINQNDITFLCETWTKTKDEFNNLIDNENLKTYFKPDKKYNNPSNMIGRPKGGIAWIIKENIACKCEHLTDRLTLLKMPKTTIIGAYMMFNDNSSETRSAYEKDLNIIFNIMNDPKVKKTDLILLGDFNIDPYRKTKFDMLLNNFVKKNNLIYADMMYVQKHNYTFHKQRKNSWIDHVICHCGNSTIVQVNLKEDKDNLSDHLAICTELNTELVEHKESINKNNNNLDWNNNEIRLDYNTKLTHAITDLHHIANKIENSIETKQIKLESTVFFNELHSCMTKCNNEICSTSERNHPKKYKKINKWWDAEMEKLHSIVCVSYENYKRSNFTDIR